MTPMVDVVFEIRGTRMPTHYRAGLWRALAARLPWLDAEPLAGQLEIRAAVCDGGYLLPRRARLGLRVPLARRDDLMALSGQRIEVDAEAVEIGRGVARALVPQPTLGTPFVASGARDELEHQIAVERMLEEFGVPRRFICGRMGELRTSQGEVLHGAPVVLHQLRDEDSMRVQSSGLGPHRHLGCGVFVPRKLISGIE